MTTANDLFNNAELAMAAYANLSVGHTDDASNLTALKSTEAGGASMTEDEAARFSARYTDVVAVYSNPDTDFQAVVFKSADGQLTLACRGTAGASDLFEDATSVAPYGCAYEQIVSMYNWWQRATNTSDHQVAQYDVQVLSLLETPPTDAVYLNDVPDPLVLGTAFRRYLVPVDSVPGEGTADEGLMQALADDPVMDVTGHSLGGHLAMAFASLFDVGSVVTFNAPGFRSDLLSNNAAFFATLGGNIPDGTNTTNVVAIEDGGNVNGLGSLISGLWSRPGAGVDVPIENQLFSDEPSPLSALNHSQMLLVDSLVVFNLLSMLDVSFSLIDYRAIFDSASNQEYKTLERIVDGMQTVFGIDSTALPAGNGSSQRNEIYQAIYDLMDSDTYTTLLNNASVQSSLGINAQQAATDFGVFLAVHYFSPLYISGAALAEPNQELYNQWSSGEFSQQYLADRTAMLGALLNANTNDTPYDDASSTYYFDSETTLTLGEKDSGFFSSTDNQQIAFGNTADNIFLGGDKEDHLYGAAGDDILKGNAGNDYLEGGTGSDILDAGTGLDRLNGGEGADVYQINLADGDAVIAGDTDGGVISLLSGINFRRASSGAANTDGVYIAVDENGEWLSGKEGWSVAVAGSTATVSLRDAQNNAHVIAIENFNISGNRFGMQFEEASAQDAPAQSAAFTVPNLGLLGSFVPSGSDEPVSIYLPENRNVPNNESAVAASAQFDWEQYRNKSLIYDASKFWGEWNAGDLHWQAADPDNEIIGGHSFPERPDEVLIYDTRAAEHGDNIMRFEGSNQNDALYGSDWTEQMRAIKAWDDSNAHILHLDEINGFNPAVNGNNDVLFGLGGDDVMIGDGDQSVLSQEAGAQTGNRDILIGGRGSDALYGMGGHDVLLGMEEYRSAWGRASVGLTYHPTKYHSVSEALFKNALLYDPETQQETQTLLAVEEQDEKNYLNGGDGSDVIEGASFTDVLDGGNDKDWIYAGAGCDVIAGGAGDDELSGDSYAYFANGIAMSDFIAPDEMPEVDDYRRAYFYQKDGDGVALRYDFDKDTDYNDVLDGGAGKDLIQGEIGNDTIAGGADDDTLFGDRVYDAGFFVAGSTLPANFQSLAKTFHGRDVVDGGDGNDLMVGGGSDDRLLGGSGNDTVYGDVGADKIEKGANTANTPAIQASDEGWWGADVLFGGAGNDVLVGEGGNDIADGGDGDDYLYGDWANWQPQAYANENAQTGDDTLYGGAGNDQLMGNSGADALQGGSGNDILFGDGKSGFSGAGDDTLDGGAGDDFLYGGSGNDLYLIAASDGQDVISDSEGSNTLRVTASQVDIETAADGSTTLYQSTDHSQFTTFNSGSYNSFALQTMSGGKVEQHQHITASGDNGSTPTYTINSSMAGSVEISGVGDAGLALQLTSAQHEFTGPAAVAVDASGAHISLAQTDGDAFTLTLDRWEQLVALTDKYGFELGFALDASAEQDGVLNGRGSDDVLTGNGGDETLYGYKGNDVLDGGAGSDVLVGGAGSDVYRFQGSDGVDVISDSEGSNTLRLDYLSGSAAALDMRVRTQGVQVLTSVDGGNYAAMDDATWQSIAACETGDGQAVSAYRYQVAAGASVALTARFAGATASIVLPEGSALTDFSAGSSLIHPQDLLLKSTDGKTFIRVVDYFANSSAWTIGSSTESEQPLASWIGSSLDNDYSPNWFTDEQAAVLQPMGENGNTLGDGQNMVVNALYEGEGEAHGARINSYTFGGVVEESIELNGGNPVVLDASEQDVMELSQKTHWVLTEVPVYRDYYTGGGIYTLSGDDPALGSMAVNGNVSLQENSDGTVTAMMSGSYTSSQVATEARWTAYTETVADVTRQYTQYHILGDAADDAVTAAGSFLGTINVGEGDNTVDLGGDHQTLWLPWGSPPRGGLAAPGAYIEAGSGDDRLIGTRGDDVFVTGSGSNTVAGGAGNDVYYVSLASGSHTTLVDAAVEGVYDWAYQEELPDASTRTDGNDWTGYYAPVNNTLVFTEAFDPSTVTYSVKTLDLETDSNGIHFNAIRPYSEYGNADWSTQINTQITLHIGGADITVLTGEDWVRDGDATEGLHITAGVQSVVLADGSSTTWDALLAQAVLVDDETQALDAVRAQLATQTFTTTYNDDDSHFVALNASDLLGGTLSDAEKARWQIVSAEQTSGNFLPDIFDIDGDGDTSSDQTFLFVENLWNSGTNYVGFIPNTTAGNASFSFTLQRDDGVQIASTMQVVVQENSGSLVGTANADVLDGGQSATALIIEAAAGDDRVFDGYGDDTVYGDDGNDVLTFGNWADNGNDIFDGGAGNDVLDAGWGSDVLIGGAGNDVYIEGNLWSGDHTTLDNSGGAQTDVDTLQIGQQGYGMWDYRALWFTREGSDLLLDQLDELADGEIRIKDWYAASDTNGDGALNDAGAGRLDIFVAQQDDGAVLQADGNSGNFDALINAMAQFGTKPASVAEAANALQEEYQAAWVQLAEPLVA